MKTTVLHQIASGATAPLVSSEVIVQGVRSQDGVVVICVDAGTTAFTIDIEGAAQPGETFHPIVQLTEAGAVTIADGSFLCSFAEFPLFPVVRTTLSVYTTAGSGYLQVLFRE